MPPQQSSPRRPPAGVALIARTHWLVSGVILFCVVLLYLALRGINTLTVAPETYLYTLGLSFLYAMTGLMVWTGAPTGRYFSYVCSLIYLARPQLGLSIWRIMGTPEYKAHFDRRPRESRPEKNPGT